MRRKVKWANVFTYIVCICAVAMLIFNIARAGQAQIKETYTVKKGDTFWSIAAERCPDDMPIQKFIHEVIVAENYHIVKRNKASGKDWTTLEPGDELLLMYYKDE